MVTDGRPEALRRECDESLRRLGTDRVELLYLHAPDENVPIEESAGALRELMEAGKTRSVGASNCTLEQLQAFHAVCPLAAVQMPYNMLQRDIEQRTHSLVPRAQHRGDGLLAADERPARRQAAARRTSSTSATAAASTRCTRATSGKRTRTSSTNCARRPQFTSPPGESRVSSGAGPHRRPARHQLDDLPARHHGRPLRRQAAVANRRNGRRDGLDTQRAQRAQSTRRSPPAAPLQPSDCSVDVRVGRACETHWHNRRGIGGGGYGALTRTRIGRRIHAGSANTSR